MMMMCAYCLQPQLYNLGALDEEGLLTKLGRKMAEFPIEPPMSKVWGGGDIVRVGRGGHRVAYYGGGAGVALRPKGTQPAVELAGYCVWGAHGMDG